MSVSTSRPEPPKKMSSLVRPGVFEVRASARRPVSALIKLDLPTLERPANAISGALIGGTDSSEPAAEMKSHAPANKSRPASISAAEKSAMVSALRSPAVRRDVTGLRIADNSPLRKQKGDVASPFSNRSRINAARYAAASAMRSRHWLDAGA